MADEIVRLRNRLRELSPTVGEWAGIPIPVEESSLRVAEGHPLKKVLEPEPKPPEEGFEVVNWWWSRRHRRQVGIGRKDGKFVRLMEPTANGALMILDTLAMSPVWGLEQERKALERLAEMVPAHTWRAYLLTGTFLERSLRSGVAYVFRRLRPTIAISPRAQKILCTLCLHPIAYYADTHAGAMCPTDDVIAHLAMMRGDEPMFWRRSNQHPAEEPQSGVGT